MSTGTLTRVATTSLPLSPLTCIEVLRRAEAIDYHVAQGARQGMHKPAHHWHGLWLRRVEKSRLLGYAVAQRISGGM